MGTISSRSPAMAFSNGGLWVSTFDESGRRCWVNDHTGERTYQFIRGLPVNPARYPSPPAFNNNGMMAASPPPWGYGMPSAAPSPAYGMPISPSQGYAMSMGPYEAGYGIGSPPVTQAGNGGLAHRLQQFYIRPSSDRSWMWR